MNNFRGSLLMVGSMAGFAIEDMFIKLLAGQMPVGQILILLGLGGGAIFWGLLARQGKAFWTRDLLHPTLMLRNGLEMIGTMGFVTALATIPLTSATAILQATPLVVVLAAALFLKEKVGHRRWSAVFIGLFGMLLIVQPGQDTFDPQYLYAVIGVLGLAGRDVITRRVPTHFPSLQLAGSAFFMVVPAGVVLLILSDQSMRMPDPMGVFLVACAIVTGLIAYLTIVVATRIAEASAIAPFRYARLVFGLLIGVLIFSEEPDIWTYIGSAIIVSSGLYTFARESRLKLRR